MFSRIASMTGSTYLSSGKESIEIKRWIKSEATRHAKVVYPVSRAKDLLPMGLICFLRLKGYLFFDFAYCCQENRVSLHRCRNRFPIILLQRLVILAPS